MSDSPASILFDVDGQPLATEAGTAPASVITVQGDPAGVPIPVTGTIDVTIPPVTIDTDGLATDVKQDEQTAELEAIKAAVQSLDTKLSDPLPVSADSLPLPLGAATDAKLDAVVTAIEGISVSIPDGLATEEKQDAQQTSLDAIKTAVQGTLTVDASGHAVPVTDNGGSLTVDGSVTATISGTPNIAVTNVPHVIVDSGTLTATVDPGGLATSEKQDEQTTALDAILSFVAGTLLVDGSAHVQPVSDGGGSLTVDGTVAVNNFPAVVHVDDNAASLTVDSAQLPATLDSGSLRVAVENTPNVTVNNFPATQNVADGGGSLTVDDGGSSLTVDGSVGVTGVVHVDDNGSTLSIDDGGGSITVDGTVTANIGTTNGLALDATLTGGTQKAIVRGGAKGSTAAADVTSTASGSNNQSLDVIRRDASGNVAPTGDNEARAVYIKTGTTTLLTHSGFDGSGYVPLRAFDADTGAGQQIVLGAVLRKSASGGSVEAGTASDPLRVDPTGTTTQPVSGTVTATIASTGATGTAFPPSATYAGFSDGTSLRGARVFDADTGAGTEYVQGAVLRKSASGGSVEAGTSSDPLRVDPTGTTTQPVSAASLPLPSGASTSALQTTGNTSLSNLDTKTPALGQATMANSSPVVLASNQSNVPVTVQNTPNVTIMNGGQSAAVKAASTSAVAADPALVVAISPNNTVAVSGTVTANIGTSGSLALDATLTGGTQKAINRGGAKGATAAADVTSTASGANHQPLDVILYDNAGNPITSFGGGTEYTDGEFTGGSAQGTMVLGQEDATNCHAMAVDSLGRVKVVDGGASLTVDDGSGSLTVDSPQLPSALVSGRLDANNGAWLGSTAPTVGQKSMANSLPVAIASDQTLPFHANISTSGTLTAVASTPVSISTAGCGSVAFQTTGTWSLTAQIEATVDGTNWVSVAAQAYGAGASSIAPVTTSSIGSATNINGVFSCAGYQNFRIRCSAYTSGTMTIALTASAAPAAMRVMQGAPSNIQNAWYQIVTDGTNTMPTADTVARSSFHRITDGTSTAAVKAASTAAVATDTALVVAHSPNFTGPTTSALTNTSAATSSTTVLSAASATRHTATLINDSTSVAYVKFGSSASSTSFSYYMAGSVSGVPATLEVPQGPKGPYQGIITAIWVSATGSMRVTEVTA